MYILGELFGYVVGTHCIYINMYVRLHVFIATMKNTQFCNYFLHINPFTSLYMYVFT